MNKKYTYLVIIFLIVGCFAAFSPIANNGFINFDDCGYITRNDNIKSGINQKSIQWALTTSYFTYWHPLTWISHMVDWNLFGANASGHHMISLLLHIGAVLFLFLFLNRTTGNLWCSAFAAAFFALHPLRVESVAWAAERKDVLSMFFGMASIYAYACYSENFKLSRYITCIILFTFALMSKPTMITLPFVFLLLDYWPLGRWQKSIDEQNKSGNSISGIITEKIPFICLSIAVSIQIFLGQNYNGAVASLERLPFIIRVNNAIVSYIAYLGKIFWPVNLAVFYPYNYSIPLWKILISVMVIISITIFVLYYIRRFHFLFVGWFWYLGTFIPLIGLIQAGQHAITDRHTYLPSIGIAIMLAWGIPLLLQIVGVRKNILFSIAMAVLCVLSVSTWIQCGYWKNSIILFNHALQLTKNNRVAYYNIGSALYAEGKIEDAINNYSEAIRIKPNDSDAYNNRGNAYIKLGQYQQAMNDFNKAIHITPNNAEAYNNYGSAYLLQGDNNLGCRYVQKACAMGVCKALEKARSNGVCD